MFPKAILALILFAESAVADDVQFSIWPFLIPSSLPASVKQPSDPMDGIQVFVPRTGADSTTITVTVTINGLQHVVSHTFIPGTMEPGSSYGFNSATEADAVLFGLWAHGTSPAVTLESVEVKDGKAVCSAQNQSKTRGIF